MFGYVKVQYFLHRPEIIFPLKNTLVYNAELLTVKRSQFLTTINTLCILERLLFKVHIKKRIDTVSLPQTTETVSGKKSMHEI